MSQCIPLSVKISHYERRGKDSLEESVVVFISQHLPSPSRSFLIKSSGYAHEKGKIFSRSFVNSQSGVIAHSKEAKSMTTDNYEITHGYLADTDSDDLHNILSELFPNFDHTTPSIRRILQHFDMDGKAAIISTTTSYENWGAW